MKEILDVVDPISTHLDVGILAASAGALEVDRRQRLLTYLAEAVFFYKVIHNDLRRLDPQSTVMEIGSGIGVLTRLIAAQGHHVIAFEPESTGFGAMRHMNDIIGAAWVSPTETITQHSIPFLPTKVADVDLAVAVNVIEHVADPARMVIDATQTLTPGGMARFICPNYAFPYEPHFGFPTVWNKGATERLLRTRIRNSDTIPSPSAFWDELSWPTVRKLKGALENAKVAHVFSRSCLKAYIARLDEPAFLDRKSPFFRRLAGPLRAPLQFGLGAVPLTVAPIIDLTTWAR